MRSATSRWNIRVNDSQAGGHGSGSFGHLAVGDAAPGRSRLVGFVDWDIASPSPREVDLAFSLMLWAPLTNDDRPHRRVHLFLDAYGYDGDRHVFATAVPERARRQWCKPNVRKSLFLR